MDVSFLRAWGLALIALGFWFLASHDSQPRRVETSTAPRVSFSSARAEQTLATILGPERPHPIGTAENAAVHARILDEFAKLGVHAETYRAFTCNPWRRGFSFIPCATVTDIIADVVPGDGKAIVMLAHYDSVPAGPGASDDESGVATVLETARALKARGGKSLHPVMAVITDGEEGGLLGAHAFLENAAFKARVGAVVNVEARGTKGPSLLFQTSPGDSRLIDLYARSVPVFATSSLYAEIYKYLPNDTDLTLFIKAGFPSFNFAFADNVRYYHSPFDTRANLDPATLQMHGDNMLGVVSTLEETDYAALKGGNDIYLTLFSTLLPRLPQSWALPAALLVFVALAFAAWLALHNRRTGWRSALAAAIAPMLLLVGSALFGWLLVFIAQIVSGRPDPAYAYPAALRFALGFGVWTFALIASRRVEGETATAGSWLWIAVFGVITAALLPGVSPYFIFPGLVAAVLLLATAERGWADGLGQAALFLSALAAFAIWIPFVVSGETLMGLRLHPLFTIPAAFALMAAVPLLAFRPMSSAVWGASTAFSALAAIVLAVVAGFMPAYSKESPQRVNIIYLQNGTAPARWIADTSWKGVGTEPIPQSLMKAGPFTRDPNAWQGLLPGGGYSAPAGAPRFPLPGVKIARDPKDPQRVTLKLDGSADASAMVIGIPKDAGLKSLDLRGEHLDMTADMGAMRILCLSPDCRDLEAKMRLSNPDAEITVAELRYGLPEFGAHLKAARPDVAMPSQSGDEVVLARKVAAH
ncbi:MAG TPA: M20/M25/M40 family metallo-hydrolase [Rhizomicrobium sp.]|nr:M20/M25/M40 family metallo-hydrolase [Rhizomicrobium sp.]